MSLGLSGNQVYPAASLLGVVQCAMVCAVPDSACFAWAVAADRDDPCMGQLLCLPAESAALQEPADR